MVSLEERVGGRCEGYFLDTRSVSGARISDRIVRYLEFWAYIWDQAQVDTSVLYP